MQTRIEKTRVVLIVLCLLTLLSGCINNKVRVLVNEDGSGHIVVSRIFGKEMVDAYTQQMEQMATQMPAEVEMPEDPFYNEKQIKMEAGQYGPGVEFLKAKKYARNGARGYVAVYKFEDINDIFINFNSAETMSMSMGGSMSGLEDELDIAEKKADSISFELKKGSPNKLHVDVPDYPAPSKDVENVADGAANKPAFDDAEAGMMFQQMGSSENPYGITGKETRGEMLRKTMKGMSTSIVLEVAAEEQESNAAHVAKTPKGGVRYVLLDMNMDEMVADDKCLQIMCAEDDGGMGFMGGMMSPDQGLNFYSDMNGLPGMTVQTNDFVVSFKGEGEDEE